MTLNAGTAETDAGPMLGANWSWAQSVLHRTQVDRLGRLWFEALFSSARTSNPRRGWVDALRLPRPGSARPSSTTCPQHYDIADVSPLTPLQQGLLFHASTTQGLGDVLYAVQLDLTTTGLSHWLRGAVHTVIISPRTWWPGFARSSTNQYSSSRPIRWCPGVTSSSTPAEGVEVARANPAGVRRERAVVCDLAHQPAPGRR